jgi:anti-anti-sigma factor
MYTTYEALGAGAVVVRIEGELDASTAPKLEKQLSACLQSGFTFVVVEMSGCPFIDSTALGVLIESDHHWPGLAIAAPTPEVRRTLEILGLDYALSVHKSIAAALQGH